MLRPFFTTALCAAALLFTSSTLVAQSPVSGFFQGKGNGSIVVSYHSESYDEVYLVPEKIVGVPVFGEVNLQSVSLYGVYGISDRFDVSVNLPFITANGQATDATLNALGFENQRSGLQDLSLHAKYLIAEVDLGECDLQFLGALGVQTPVGSYEVEEGLQSILAIGNRATRLNGFAGAHFKTASGFFATAQGGYSLRSGDVPNAVLSELKLGYAASKFYLDAWLATQLSTSGVDILGEGFQGIFPETRVSYTRVGGSVYVPIAGGLGVSGGVSSYVGGRNIGNATGFYGAVVYAL